MSLGSLSLSALTPGFFALLPVAIAALYWIYRQGGPRKVLSVPTLFLLKKFEGQIVSRQKFFPPPRAAFFVSLCFLLILIGGSLVLEDSRNKHVVLIDNSLSTFARSRTAGAIIEQLKSRAQAFIEDRPAALYTLYVLCPTLQAQASSVEASQALSLLSSIHAGYCEDRLEERVAEIQSQHSSEELVVFTDRPLNSSPQNPREQIRALGTGRTEALANVGLLNLTVSPKLSAVLKAFSPSPVDTETELLAHVGNAWQTVRRTTQRLTPGITQNVQFEEPLPSGTDAVHVVLRTNSAANSLAEDDEAYALVRRGPEGELPTVAVLSPLTPEQLGLMHQGKSAIPGLTFVQTTREALEKGGANWAAVIAHRMPLPGKAQLPTLEVLDAPSEREVQNPQITRWDTGNPVLTYLNLRTLHFDILHPLQASEDERTIISTTHGPALTATDALTIRRVRTGFELFPFEGARSPTMSILLLNALRWLSAKDLGSSFQRPYSDPRQSWIPGLHSESPETPSVAVSFFSEHESNSLDPSPWSPPAALATASSQVPSTHTFSDELSALVLVLLIAEALWILYKFRARRLESA